jgi:hypothetical protein
MSESVKDLASYRHCTEHIHRTGPGFWNGGKNVSPNRSAKGLADVLEQLGRQDEEGINGNAHETAAATAETEHHVG